MARGRKRSSVKQIITKVWADGKTWSVHFGRLRYRKQGNPGGHQLFQVVAQKLPYASLIAVRRDFRSRKLTKRGVYIAHDSMGCPRYIGRGNVFSRLALRKRRHPLELAYFSFYIVSTKKHEREIETLLIRAASTLLHFNEKKKRIDISPGSVRDYEPGIRFYERQRKKGKKT